MNNEVGTKIFLLDSQKEISIGNNKMPPLKALYKPTSQNTIVLNEFEQYCEILLDGEYKTVLKNDLKFLNDTLKLSSLEDFKENIFLNCIKNPLSDILYSYNTNRLIPEPHQYKPLIKFLNSENNRVLIADEVGLGKTIEAGMIYKEIDKREDLKISLIVVPSSLTLKWQEELFIRFDEWFEIYKTNQFLHLINEYDSLSGVKHFKEKIIISYHTLRDEKVMKKLQKSFFEVDFLIMDEAHTMRNNGTSTFYSAEIITAIAGHIIFLSATPVQNKLSDIFNILSLLENDYFKDFEFFQKMIAPNGVIHKVITMLRNNYEQNSIKLYIDEHIHEITYEELRSIFLEIMAQDFLSAEMKVQYIDKLTKSDHLSFIINRTKKKDVGRSLPRNAKSLTVSISESEREYYNAVIEFVKFLNPSTPQGFITIMPERMASSSMIASLQSFKDIRKSGKLFIKDIDDLEDYYEDMDIRQEAIRYLDNVISKGEMIGDEDSKFLKFEEILKDIKAQKIKQLIVFSFFKKTLNYLEEKLFALGYKVGKIHGDLSVEERFAKIKAFKNGDFDILLSSEVGSEGLDMQFCNVIINYDLPWNPMRVEQRIGRIDRIGQKFDKLHIFNLCIEGSIEERIYIRLYEKLNIFENSIGELEPILGSLEYDLNLSELINLSQEEIDAKLHLQELAIKRQEIEIKEQNSEVEKLINDDINHKSKEDDFINITKINILQQQSKVIFKNFLTENSINYLELKDGSIKFSSENLKKLFNLLKDMMSDKRTESSKYNDERAVLQKISKQKELKVSFSTNNNEEFQTIYIYLNHPIILMITKNKQSKQIVSLAKNATYKNGFAIVFRVDLKQLKSKSYIKTILLKDDFSLLDECDYFEFINVCEKSDNSHSSVDMENVKSKAMHYIINSIENQIVKEQEIQNRILNTKISSINNYFEKQIQRVKKLQEQVIQEDVQRMRIAEIDNLEKQRDKKIVEFEAQKELKSSFEILGIVWIVE